MNPFERSISGNTGSFGNQRRPVPWLAVHAGFVLCLLPFAQAQDPIMTLHPTSQTVLEGANVFMSVQATSTNGPTTYQWQRDDPAAPMTFTNIPNAMRGRLDLRNVTLPDTGDYRAVVFNASGDSAISDIAHLTVKAPDFTRITEGPLVTTSGVDPQYVAWGDINNDGYEDLIIGDVGYVDWNGGRPTTRAVPQVYLNNQDGTFRRATEDDIGPLATSATAGGTAALADYDNDGYLDFYQNAWFETCRLWRGGPNGRFTLVTENIGPNVKFHGEGTWGYAWGDYDRDGLLDLYVTTAWESFGGTTDYLFHNRGDGTFERLPSPIALSVNTLLAYWADYDNDGDQDLLVTSSTANQDTFFYRNDGDGRFTLVNLPAGSGFHLHWGDYDNDGDLDFIGYGLFENDGDGGFVRKYGEGYPIVGLNSWVDTDNDGQLEVVVGTYLESKYRLYRCDPETKLWYEVPSGLNSIPKEDRRGAWADYDNDGFMDFAVASRPNKLYRNNGNGNHWLHVKPVGTRSNRSAIGARITVEAAIFGKLVSQMREISSTCYNQSLRAHFGLGDATEIRRLIIRWPNGAREELTGIAPNQILTVVEPSVHTTRQADGSIWLQVWGNAGRSYSVQTSSDFETWTTLETVTGKGTEGPVEITDPATDGPRRFYRMTVP